MGLSPSVGFVLEVVVSIPKGEGATISVRHSSLVFVGFNLTAINCVFGLLDGLDWCLPGLNILAWFVHLSWLWYLLLVAQFPQGQSLVELLGGDVRVHFDELPAWVRHNVHFSSILVAGVLCLSGIFSLDFWSVTLDAMLCCFCCLRIWKSFIWLLTSQPKLNYPSLRAE